MSYLDSLLENVDVEWKSLGEIATLVRGNGLPKSDFTEQGVGCIHYGQIYTYYGTSAQFTKSYVSEETAKGLKQVNPNDIIITNTSENVEDVCKAVVWEGDGNIVTGGHATIIKGLPVPRFFVYYTQTKRFFDMKKKLATGIKVIDVSANNLAKIKVPIPCPGNPEKSLAIQKEIVRILDTFEKLTAELTAELTARKKQYEYYRNQLLGFKELSDLAGGGNSLIVNGLSSIPSGIYLLPLSEIAQYAKDKIEAAEVDEDNYVGVDNLLQNKQGKTASTYVPANGRLTKYEEKNILIGNIRPYLKKIWYSDNLGGTNGDVLVIQVTSDLVLPKYLYTVLCGDKFFDYNMQHAKGAKMPRGSKDAIMRYQIPIPSIKEQQRIVTILDKFDTLTTSISEGLPKEIELRKKQFEYYRDMLLSFPKPA
ncbi:MAG: restriction endonuclease subunit S [Rikenellaceae bacterium]